MFEYLESLDNTKFGRFFKMFLAPIWFIMEWLCFKKYWNIILSEIIENDPIIDFLDKNEFGLRNNKIYKKDLIDNNEFLKGRSLQECQEIVKKEYVIALTDIFKKYCNINIEEILSLIVKTDTLIVNGIKNNIYEVSLQYCRLWWFYKAKTYFTWWLVITILIVVITFLIFNLIHI